MIDPQTTPVHHKMVMSIFRLIGEMSADAFAIKLAMAGEDPSKPDAAEMHAANGRRFESLLLSSFGRKVLDEFTYATAREVMLFVARDILKLLEAA